MYAILLVMILIAGLVLLFIPVNAIKKWHESKVFFILLRLIGIILVVVSVASLYALLSGAIVLPLFNK